MVTVHFKLSDFGPVSLELNRPETVATILDLCKDHLEEEIGAVIAMRDGKVVTLHDLIGPDDSLELFPAISGG